MMRIMRTTNKEQRQRWTRLLPISGRNESIYLNYCTYVLEDYFLSKPRYSYSIAAASWCGEERRRAKRQKERCSKFCSYFVKKKRETKTRSLGR